jgi:hypothetical protein
VQFDIGRQFIFEFVNAALYGRSTVVVAPDFQRGVAAIGDENPKDIAGQINKLAADAPPKFESWSFGRRAIEE